MQGRFGRWHKRFIVFAMMPPIFFAAMLVMSRLSELHTIAFRLPGGAYVVQHGVMVLMYGDYEAELRAINQRALEPIPSPISLFKRRKPLPAAPVAKVDDTPRPMQIAGYALVNTQYDRPWLDVGFVKIFVSGNRIGGDIVFVRFELGYTIPVSAFLPALLIISWYARKSVAKQQAARGICVYCGYDVRSVSEPRCPECGAEFGQETLRAMELRKQVIENIPPRPSRIDHS